MKVIVCLDDNKGMMFNRRRLSRDSKVIDSIISIVDTETLYMNSYSYALFKNQEIDCVVDDYFLDSNDDVYYFVEDNDLSDYESDIDEIIIYWWNRNYPSDIKFAIDLSLYSLYDSEEFIGNSHEKITKEIYKKGRLKCVKF